MIDLFYPLTFLFFCTLHADQLNIVAGGFTIRANNVLALMLMSLLLICYRDQLFKIHKSLLFPLVAITGSVLISALLSPYRMRCLFYSGWWGLTLLCYVLLPYLLMRMWDFKKVFALYCASFLVVGGYACLQLVLSFFGIKDPCVTQFLYYPIARPNACCFEPSFYALYMTSFVFLYNAYFLSDAENELFPFRKSTLIAICINTLYVVSTSTAIFFAYLIFFASAFLFPSVNRRRLITFLVSFGSSLGVLMLTVPFLAKKVFMKFFFQGFMGHYSFYERWVGLVNGWKIFLRHPFFGVGLGGYSPYLYHSYLTEDREFTFLTAHALNSEVSNPFKLFESMNVTTELLASLGLLGLCAFIWLLYNLFSEGIRSKNTLTSPLLISCLVTILVLQLSQGLLRTYLWTHLALTFAYFDIYPNNLKNWDLDSVKAPAIDRS